MEGKWLPAGEMQLLRSDGVLLTRDGVKRAIEVTQWNGLLSRDVVAGHFESGPTRGIERAVRRSL